MLFRSIAGTATDSESGVRKVEISVDGGLTWHEAFGQQRWSIVVTGVPAGPVPISARAVDWAGLTGVRTEDVWIVFNPMAPHIELAGYGATRVQAGETATVSMNALVRDPWDSVFIDQATLYLNGQPTDSVFTAESTAPGYAFFRLEFEETFTQVGRPDFSIVVTDIYGNRSVPWPRLPLRW